MAVRPTPDPDRVTARLPAARRRRQLLNVAGRAFAVGGYHGTSMDDVAEAAGVTKPVLYQHFGSKRELYIELLDDTAQQLMTAITEATSRAGSPRAQVENGVAAYFGFVAEHEGAFRLLFGGGTKRDLEFAGAVASVEEAIADVIAALIAADIDQDHRAVLGHAIVGMAEGACRHWMAGNREVGPAELAREVAELAWSGLRGVSRPAPA
jgi:AcrR family transcriptional regulator